MAARIPFLRSLAKDCVASCMMGLLITASCNGGDDDTTDVRAENEPNDTIIQAESIPVGVTLLGSVDEDGDQADFFLFISRTSGPNEIILDGFGDNDLDLLLYARNGLLLDSSESSGSPETINRILSVGTQYAIEVRAISTSAATAYTLRIDD